MEDIYLFQRDLTESNTKKATLFQRIIYEMVIDDLERVFFVVLVPKIRASSKKNRSYVPLPEVADKYIPKKKKSPLSLERSIRLDISQRHRHRLHEMVRATEDTNEKFTVIVGKCSS